MKLVHALFQTHIFQDKYKGRNAQAQADDVDEAEHAVADQVAGGDF